MKKILLTIAIFAQVILLQAQKSIDVTYIANTGFLISNDTNKVLIDGIFNESYSAYFTPTAQALANERNAVYPFNKIDIILITHAHQDHINPAYLTEHMKNNGEAKLLAPYLTVNLLKPIVGYNAIKSRIRSITSANQSKLDTTINGTRIISMALKHIDSTFLPTLNLGYIFYMNGFKLFHPGDADSSSLNMYQNLNLADDSIDIAFVPYWFFQTNTGKSIVKYLNPKAIIITHLQLPQQTYNYTYARNLIKNTTGLPPVYFMEACMDKLNFVKNNNKVYPFNESDSAYLGQTPPGNIPKKFNFPASTGVFAAERIAISTDGKEIFYSELNNYPPTVANIKYFKFENNRWNGPNEFSNNQYFAPALSPDGNTLFFEKNQGVSLNSYTYFSSRNGTTWSEPSKFLSSTAHSHYVQSINSGTYYLSSDAAGGLGYSDWGKLVISNSDTTFQSFGVPLNSTSDILESQDFFVAADESDMIISAGRSGGFGSLDLYISYKKSNGTWTNPKNLGQPINSPNYEWGPYVTKDNKYLFYSSYINSNQIYWVRADSLIDSLQQTNFIPYLKTPIADQTVSTGLPFSFTIPANTFIDDDGNNTLAYNAKLINGNPLPSSWLKFDSITRKFSGTPLTEETLNIRVIATDNANAGISNDFKIIVKSLTELKNTEKTGEIIIYPNPTSGLFTIFFGESQVQKALIKIYNLQGCLIFSETVHNKAQVTIDLTGFPQGMYLVKVIADGISYEEKLFKE